jgi:hypothetical protein
MDWANEIVNALVLHFNGHAALWTVTGSSSFVILIGLTIEILAVLRDQRHLLHQAAARGPQRAHRRPGVRAAAWLDLILKRRGPPKAGQRADT